MSNDGWVDDPHFKPTPAPASAEHDDGWVDDPSYKALAAQPEGESWGRKLARGAIDNVLPIGGALGAGILAAPETAGLASIPAAAAGYAGGKEAARALDHYLFGDDIGAKNLKDVALQTGKDLGEGAAFEFGGKLIGKGLEAAAPYAKPVFGKIGDAFGSASEALTGVANDRAASALGFGKALRKKLGDDAVQDVGRSGLDNNVLGWFNRPKNMLSRAQDLTENAGQTIGDTMTHLDKQGIKEFNPLDAATKADAEIGAPYRNEPLFKGLSNQYDNALDTILNRANPDDLSQNISYAEAQKLKNLFSQYGYNEGIALPGKEMAQKIGGVVGDELEGAVGRGAEKLSDPEMAKRYLAAKRDYGAGKNMQTALEDRVAKSGNQGSIIGGLLGLKNAGAKMVGGTIAGPLGVVGGDVAATGVRAFGDQIGAKSADLGAKGLKAASEFLMKTPKFAQMASENPSAFKALAMSLAQRSGGGAALPAAASNNELDNDSSKSSNYKPELTPGDHEDAKAKFLQGN